MAQQQLLRIVTCMWIMNLAVSQDLRLTISDGSVPMPQSNNYYNQRQQFVSQQGDDVPVPSNEQYQVPQFIPQVPELNREQPGLPPVIPPSEKIPYGNDGLKAPSNQQFQVPQLIQKAPELNREQPGFAPVVPPSENIPYGNDGLMAPSNQQYQAPQFIPQAPELNQEQPGLPPVVPPSEKIPYGNDYLMPPANQQFQVPQFIPQAPAWNGEQLRLPSDVPQSEKIPYGNDGLKAPSNQQYQVPQFIPQVPELNQEQPGLPPVIPPSQNIQYDNNIESSESSSDGEDSVHSNSDYDSDYQYSGGNYGGYYSILNKLGANGNYEVGDGSDGVNLSDWPSYPNSYDEESWKPPSEGAASQTGEEVKTAAVNVPKTNLQAKGTSSKNIVGGTSIWVYCIPLFLLIVLILLIRSNSYFGHSPKIVTVDPESNITRSKIDARTKEIEPLLREKMEYTDESS